MEWERDQGSSHRAPVWVNCKKEWFNVFKPKSGSKQLSGILHKAAWQGILHAEALQLLRCKQMHGKMTPIALAPSDTMAPSPPHRLPLSLTNCSQDSAGKLDHGKEAGIKLSAGTKQRQTQVPWSPSSCLDTKWRHPDIGWGHWSGVSTGRDRQSKQRSGEGSVPMVTPKGLQQRTVPVCSWRMHTLFSCSVFGEVQESFESMMSPSSSVSCRHGSVPLLKTVRTWSVTLGCKQCYSRNTGLYRAAPGGCGWWESKHPWEVTSHCHCCDRNAESRCGMCLSCTRYVTWQCLFKMLCAPAELGQLQVLQRCMYDLLQNCSCTCNSGRGNSAHGVLLRSVWYEAESWSFSRDVLGFLGPPLSPSPKLFTGSKRAKVTLFGVGGKGLMQKALQKASDLGYCIYWYRVDGFLTT